ncbi:B12-binding domain-containing radical SAM protein [Planctomycetota bacterium]
MRIALVNPVEARLHGYQSNGSYIPQLGLRVLAKQTPAEHSIDIIDEIFGQNMTIKLLQPTRYDLVGITAYTCQATRAYELANHCRRLGLPTIMGGPHASALLDEAGKYVNSVVVGEADEIWPRIIADAAVGKLKKFYPGSLADLNRGYGVAAQSLQPVNGRYDVGCIQTSRGCPVGCEYCSVTSFNGAKIRRRSIPDILQEWNSTPNMFLFMVDDNFFGITSKHAAWAKDLLRHIIKYGKKRLWFSQTTINMGEDLEAVKLAYQAGCRGMLVGLESFNPKNLMEYHKGINTRNIERYRELVDGFHAGGLAVFGAFVVGAEQDTQDAVADTVLQAVQIGIDIIQITNLTPLPGTRLYDRLLSEDRIFATNYPHDWKRFSFIETIYHPRKMTSRQLDETIYELRHAAATQSWIWKRTLKTMWRTRSVSTACFVHGLNNKFVRLAKAIVQEDGEHCRFRPKINQRTEKIRRAMAFFTKD